MHRLIMQEQPFLSRLVVIRRYDQSGVRTRFLGRMRIGDCFFRIIAARSGNNGNPSFYGFNAQFDRLFIFLRRHHGAFPRCAADNQTVDPRTDLEFDQPDESVRVNLSFVKRSD